MGNDEEECRALIKRALISYSDILRESVQTIKVEKETATPITEEERKEFERFEVTRERNLTLIPALKSSQRNDLCPMETDSALDTIRYQNDYDEICSGIEHLASTGTRSVSNLGATDIDTDR